MDTPTRGEMPFLDHLEELRRRILWSVLAVVVGSAIGIFAVIELEVVDVLTAPLYGSFERLASTRPELAQLLGDGRLVFNNLTVPFFFVLRVGVAVGFLLASPVVAYHVWGFLAPALEERERRVIIPSLYLGLVLFAAGVALAYFLALPLAIRFMLGFGVEMFTPILTADAYLSMVWRLLLVFGLVFELPVVVMILSALGLVTPAFLRSKRRHAIVALTVLASVMIPGDTITLTLLLLVPMVALYEASILLSSLARRERVEVASLIVPLVAILEARNRLARRSAPLMPLLVGLSLAGCGDVAGEGEEEHAMAEWTLTEELRIGAVDGGDQNLTRVEGILPFPDGSVWILQVEDHQVRVYSPAGDFVRTIGQRGQGPGEFLLPDGLGWWGRGTDTIWVKDNQRRITLLTPDGEYARSFDWTPTDYLDSWRVGEPDVFLSDGTGLAIARKNPPEPLLDSRLIRYDPATSDIHGEVARLRRIEAVRSTASTTLRLPVPYHEIVAYSPDGSWVAVVDRAAPGLPDVGELPVHAISTTGDTLWSRAFTYQPSVIPPAYVDSVLNARTESRLATAARTGETRDQARAWVEERITFPGHRPPIENALIGQDGRLWIEWTAPQGSVPEWWVLDREGRPEGRIAPTRRMLAYAADEETVWTVELDALDVPFVVRYRFAEVRGWGSGALSLGG